MQWNEAIIDAETRAHGVVRPPWARYPSLPAGCIGWRMGDGESWLVVWQAWLERQTWSRDERIAYLRRYPAPKTWDLAAVSVVEPDLDEDDDRTGDVADELERLHGIRNDVAYFAWKAIHGTNPPMPWADGASIRTAARYDTRSLWFYARWARECRSDASLGRLTEGVLPWSWRSFRKALRVGRVPNRLPWHGLEKLAVLIAARVNPPAPWNAGQAPASMTGAAGDRVSYADAWALWILTAFDDEPTYHDYLAGESVPVEWRDALAARVSWYSTP